MSDDKKFNPNYVILGFGILLILINVIALALYFTHTFPFDQYTEDPDDLSKNKKFHFPNGKKEFRLKKDTEPPLMDATTAWILGGLLIVLAIFLGIVLYKSSKITAIVLGIFFAILGIVLIVLGFTNNNVSAKPVMVDKTGKAATLTTTDDKIGGQGADPTKNQNLLFECESTAQATLDTDTTKTKRCVCLDTNGLPLDGFTLTNASSPEPCTAEQSAPTNS